MKGAWVVILFICASCNGKSISKCGSDQFSCKDGSCIHKLKWCDGRSDCIDDTDEDYCNTKSGLDKNPNRCDESFFLCNNGPCIPIIGRCDGYVSCYDNSDEEGCSTAADITESSITLSAAPLKHETTETLPFTLDSIHTETLSAHTHAWVQVEDVTKTTVMEAPENGSYPDYVPEVHVHSIDTESKNLEMDITTQEVYSKHNFSISSSTVSDAIVGLKTSTNSGDALQFEEAVNGVLRNKLPTDSQYSGITKESAGQNVFHKILKYPPVVTELDNLSTQGSLQEMPKVHDLIDTSTTSGNFDAYDVALADTKTFLNSTKTMADSEKDFIELKARDISRTKALDWLLKSRNADYSWGKETHRAIIAVYMADDSTKKRSREEMPMSKQLHLELLQKLIRNDTNPISLVDLSLYINALVASCNNPKDFYGKDLVDILRQRTDVAHEASEVVTPLVYFTLCINNATTYADVNKIDEIISKFNKVDIGALASLASTCIARMQQFSSSRISQLAAKKLLQRIMDEGLPENIYELSLLTQALNEARINQDLWHREIAMFHITNSQQSDGSFGDVMSTYYTVPVLSGRSLLSLGQQCIYEDKDLDPLEIIQNKAETMEVQYSLYYSDKVQVSQSLKMRVLNSSSFLDVMRIAETINPAYRFKIDTSKREPIVYSIGGVANDAERGLYWTLYLSRQNSTEDLVPYEGDIRSLVPRLDENIVFWRKSVF